MTQWLTPAQDKALRDNLAALPELGALAATCLPGEHLGSEGGARSVPGSRPPLNVAALDLVRRGKPDADPVAVAARAATEIAWVGADGRARPDAGLQSGILTTIASWTRMAEGEMLDAGAIAPDTLAPVPTVESECAWLLRHVLWLLEQRWVCELSDDVHRMTRECKQVLRERPAYRPKCPHCPTGIVRDEGSGLWRCDTCEQTAGNRDRLSLRAVVAQQRPMTSAEIEKAFDVAAATLRKWVERGHLAPVLDDHGKPLARGKAHTYHVVDVLRVLDA